MFTPQFLTILLSLTTLTLAAPQWYEKYHHPRVIVSQSYYEVLKLRSSTPLNPRAATNVVCLDRRAHIPAHDEIAASLAICDNSLTSPSSKCATTQASTIGKSGKALFSLRTVGDDDDSKGSITLSKEEWVQCVRAARDACPTGSVEGVCPGGASMGRGRGRRDVKFQLTAV